MHPPLTAFTELAQHQVGAAGVGARIACALASLLAAVSYCPRLATSYSIELPCTIVTCALRVRRIGKYDNILIIQPHWLEEILNGKSWEIRGKSCHGKVGKRIWLCASRSKSVSARAKVVACHGPLSEDQWEASKDKHRVFGPRRYGSHTYAYELAQVARVQPAPIQRKQGSVDWQTGPGW